MFFGNVNAARTSAANNARANACYVKLGTVFTNKVRWRNGAKVDWVFSRKRSEVAVKVSNENR